MVQPVRRMFVVEARSDSGANEGQAAVLWYRDLDRHWTHHFSRVQFYPEDMAQALVASLPPLRGYQIAVIPAQDVPS